MKVYVDSKDIELTKELFERANVYDWYNCNLDDELELVSLSDYTKQVRNEVVQEIRNKLKENGLLYTWNGEPKYKTMEELLDQIQFND